MAVIAGLLGAMVASLGVAIFMVAALVWLGIDNYKGPGHNAIVYGTIGVVFAVFGVAFTGTKNWVSRRKIKSHTSASETSDEPFSSKTETALGQNRQKSFDAEKWDALIKYDQDIAQAAELLRPLGDKWIDVLARDYLALNDKQYLSSIVRKIISDAKSDAAARTANEPVPPRGPVKKKNNTVLILMLCLAGIGAVIGTKELVRTWSVHQALLLAEGEVRKQLPIKYKSNITLTDIKIGYLGVTYVNDVTDAALAQFSNDLSGLERDVRKGICASADMRTRLSDGVSYSYVYRNFSKTPVASFEVASCP